MNTNAIEIVVREIPNDDAALCSLLGEDERAYLSKLSDARRREWTAWRATLRSQAERWALSDSALRVAYAPSGEPLFVGLEGSISVTHSRRYVALVRAWEGRCGIDIEQLDRNYERIEDKYISATEKESEAAHDERFRAVVWCAKEAVYKCLGQSGVDFRRDLQVTEVDFGGGRVRGRALGKEFEGVLHELDGAILVAVTTNQNPHFTIEK